MQEFAHTLGLAEVEMTTLPFQKWQRSIDETWFSSQTAFLSRAVYAPIHFPQQFTDTPTIRAITVFCHYGLIQNWTKCCVVGCQSMGKLTEQIRSDTGGVRYIWTCCTGGRDHMQESVSGLGPLAKVRVAGWMAFLNFISLLRIDMPLHLGSKEVQTDGGRRSNIVVTKDFGPF